DGLQIWQPQPRRLGSDSPQFLPRQIDCKDSSLTFAGERDLREMAGLAARSRADVEARSTEVTGKPTDELGGFVLHLNMPIGMTGQQRRWARAAQGHGGQGKTAGGDLAFGPSGPERLDELLSRGAGQVGPQTEWGGLVVGPAQGAGFLDAQACRPAAHEPQR